jgi:hypothetical protein
MTIEDDPPEFERSLQLSCDRLRRRVDEQKARAETAEAACAEMRAALQSLLDCRGTTPPRMAHFNRVYDDCVSLLARTDLGRGKVVVERTLLERLMAKLPRPATTKTWGDPEWTSMLTDLDAVLKKGGG